jgi:hypothetical protein
MEMKGRAIHPFYSKNLGSFFNSIIDYVGAILINSKTDLVLIQNGSLTAQQYENEVLTTQVDL